MINYYIVYGEMTRLNLFCRVSRDQIAVENFSLVDLIYSNKILF